MGNRLKRLSVSTFLMVFSAKTAWVSFGGLKIPTTVARMLGA
jgi:hypothetical protein